MPIAKHVPSGINPWTHSIPNGVSSSTNDTFGGHEFQIASYKNSSIPMRVMEKYPIFQTGTRNSRNTAYFQFCGTVKVVWFPVRTQYVWSTDIVVTFLHPIIYGIQILSHNTRDLE